MAAIIKKYQQNQVEQAIAPVGIQATKTGAEALGRGVSDIGSMFDSWQDEIDTADAKSADADYSEIIRQELYADQTGFMYSQGGDSINRRGSVSERLEAEQERILSTLGPAARSRAQSAMQARLQRGLQTVDQHTAGQRQVYLDGASQARITSSVNDAIFNPDAIGQSLSINRNEILDMADRNGWSPEETKLRLDESSTAIYGGVVDRLSKVDPVAALEYLRDNRDKMMGKEVARLESQLVPIAREYAGRAKGAAAAAGGGALPEGFDWSNHITGGGTRADAISGLDDGFEVSLAHLISAAPPEMSKGLSIGSGFRSYEVQERLWNNALKKYGSAEAARKWVAPPGKSNHNGGDAVDINYQGKSLKHAPKEVVEWVHSNAAKFGIHFPLSHEPWHAERLGTRGTTAWTPPSGGIESLLSITDPDERAAAVSEYNLLTGVRKAQTEAVRQGAEDAAFKMIESGGNINDLPMEYRQGIGREAMSSLRSYQEKLASGTTVLTDDEFYVELADRMAQKPEEFMQSDPMVWRDKLDDKDFEFFVKQRSDLIAGRRKAGADAPSITTLRTAASTALKSAGLDGDDDLKSGFESQLLRWSSEFTSEQGRAPNPLEVNDRVNQMLVPVVLDPKGFGNKQKGKSFQIDYDGAPLDTTDDLRPEDIRDGALKIGGEKISNEIIEAFATQFADRFGRAPTVQELVDGIIATGAYQ